MSYQIDLAILDGQTPIEDLKTWLRYADEQRAISIDVLVGYMSPDVQGEWAKGLKGREVTDADLDVWRDRILDWRGVVDANGAEVPFTTDRRDRLWSVDPKFRAWLVTEAQPFDNFRCPRLAPPAA